MPISDPEGAAAYHRAYYAAHREQKAAYGAAHREEIVARKRAQYAAHREERRAVGVAYYAAHAEQKAAYQRAYYAAHPEQVAAYQRAYWAAHPARHAAHAAARRGRKLDAEGVATVAEIAARWTYHGNKCWMCGAEATCTDHVKPLARGGSNWPANLRPACKSCNSGKGGTWPFAVAA